MVSALRQFFRRVFAFRVKVEKGEALQVAIWTASRGRALIDVPGPAKVTVVRMGEKK